MFAAFESFFVFDGEYYIEVDGVAMGFPLGPTLANAFLCYYEKKWLRECPEKYLNLKRVFRNTCAHILFINLCVVVAMQLITVKLKDTFLQEHQNI